MSPIFHFCSLSLTIQPYVSNYPWINIDHNSGELWSRYSRQLNVPLEILPNERIFLHWYSSPPRLGLWYCSNSISAGVSICFRIIFKPGPIFFLVIGIPNAFIGTNWKNGGNVAGDGAKTPTTYFLIRSFSRPIETDDRVLLCILYFLVDKSYNTQLMISSLGHIVTWWLVVKLPVCIRANDMRKTFSQKDSSNLQKMV